MTSCFCYCERAWMELLAISWRKRFECVVHPEILVISLPTNIIICDGFACRFNGDIV